MKFLVCVSVLLLAVVVSADEDDFGCKICENVVTDFSKELTDNTLQGIVDRLCDDLTEEFPDYDKTCKEAVDGYFEMIRVLIQMGDSPKDVCKSLGACGWSSTLVKRIQEKTGRSIEQLRVKQMLGKFLKSQ